MVKYRARGWRSRSRAALNKGRHSASLRFTDKLKTKFLDYVANNGTLTHAAAACGISNRTYKDAREKDEEFAIALEEAQAFYHDVVCNAMREQGVEGVPEPVLGGKYKDQVITHVRRFTPGILALEAKRVEPGYREKTQAKVDISGGVLLIPAGKEDAEAWQKENAAGSSKLLDEVVEATTNNASMDDE